MRLQVIIISILFVSPISCLTWGNLLKKVQNKSLIYSKSLVILWGKGFSQNPIPTVSKKKSVSESKNSNVKDEWDISSDVLNSIRKDGESDMARYCPTFNLQFDGLRKINTEPPVFEIENFFSNYQCDQYIDRAKNRGVEVQSQTFSPLTKTKRTSTTWYLQYKDAAELLLKANHLTGLSIKNYEEPQVVRYEMGQQFSWHFDTIPKSLLKATNGGQRIATLLVYLNDVNQGGCTCFRDLNIKVKPEKGKALIFFPAFADGTPDERTLHAGQMALDTKWIAQIWLHTSEYTPREEFGGRDGHDQGIAAVEKLEKDKTVGLS